MNGKIGGRDGLDEQIKEQGYRQTDGFTERSIAEISKDRKQAERLRNIGADGEINQKCFWWVFCCHRSCRLQSMKSELPSAHLPLLNTLQQG